MSAQQLTAHACMAWLVKAGHVMLPHLSFDTRLGSHGTALSVVKEMFEVSLTEEEVRELETKRDQATRPSAAGILPVPAILQSGMLKDSGSSPSAREAVSKEGGGHYA